MDDLYSALGVASDATTAEIRAAYLTRARALHPDKLPLHASGGAGGSPQAFTGLQRAYEVLSDPAARSVYDSERKASVAGRPAVAAVSEDLWEDELEIEGPLLRHPCRCGDGFRVTIAALRASNAKADGVVVQCGSCSLFIRVRPVDEAEAEDEVGPAADLAKSTSSSSPADG